MKAGSVKVAHWRRAGPLLQQSTAYLRLNTHHTAHCLWIDAGVCIGIGWHVQVVVGLLRSAVEAIVHDEVDLGAGDGGTGRDL